MGFRSGYMAAKTKFNRKAHGLKFTQPASWKWRIEDQKTRTLERHKSAPPESSKPLKGWLTRVADKNPERFFAPLRMTTF